MQGAEFMIKQQLNKFLDRELKEIRKNKRRIGSLFACVLFAIGIFVFANSGEKTDNNSNEAVPKADATKLNDKSNSDKKTESKLTAIKGLERAAANVELINPFKVDIQKSAPVVDNKPVEAAKVPPNPTIALITPPTQPAQTENTESKEKIILILKGTAISGDNKIAIIQRGILKKSDNNKDNKYNNSKDSDDLNLPKNDRNSKNFKDQSKIKSRSGTTIEKIENLMLNVGDEISGKKITDIGIDFVIFDNGERLTVQEGLSL